jgi:amino acid adenylation domain-containing protein
MTVGQHGLWFLSQVDARVSASYNVVMAYACSPEIDAGQLQRAWDAICSRHPLLVARVEIADFVPRFVLGECCACGVETWPGDVRETALRESATPIDFACGPLHRIKLVTNERGQAKGIVLTVAHLVFDGASADVLQTELALALSALLSGETPVFGQQPSSQQALVEIELAYMRSDEGRLELARQVRRLAGASKRSAPPLAGRRGGKREARMAAAVRKKLPTELVQSLGALAARERATTAAVHLALLYVLVWQYSGRADFTISVPVSTRDSATASAVGYLTNLGIALADVDPSQTGSSLIRAVSDQLFDLIDGARIPYPELARALKVSGEDIATLQPLIGFNVLRPRPAGALVGPAALQPISVDQQFAKDSMALDVEERDGGVCLTLLYDRDVFDAVLAEDMLEQYVALAQRLCQEPGTLIACIAVTSDAFQARLARLSQSKAPAAAAIDVIDVFDERAQTVPEAVAVHADGRSWSYAELRERANRLAHALHARGVGTEVPVAVVLPRGAASVAAMLGILKAGGVYMPLDLGQPGVRLADMLSDGQPTVVLAQRSAMSPLPSGLAGYPVLDIDEIMEDAELPLSDPDRAVLPAQLAYAIYTSGSTGKPKAVGVSLAALGGHISGCLVEYGVQKSDRVLQFAPMHLDPSIEQVFSTLCAGASLYMRCEETWSPSEMTSFIDAHGITVADIPTAYWNAYATDDFALLRSLSLRLLIIGGEAAPAHAVPITRLPFDWINAYGPTETTVTALSCTNAALDTDAAHLCIGAPVSNTCVYVLDSMLRPVPPGACGEICIAGPRLARGYLGRPALTAEKFVPCPWGRQGDRLYRTGDLGRFRSDGQVEFLGRIDDQIKIRGFRVELGEIESSLCGLPGVQSAAVVLADADDAQAQRLVAYVVAPGVSAESLRTQLSASLPSHMVPTGWLLLEALPLGRNGKIDRQALPRAPKRETSDVGYVEPTTPTEKIIAAVWADVLRLPLVGLRDNFFALGGHSLLATQIVTRLSRQLSRPVSLRTLLDAPTVGDLATKLDASPPAADLVPPPLVRQRRSNAAGPV